MLSSASGLQTSSLVQPQPCDRARCFTSGPPHRSRQRRRQGLARAEEKKKEGKGLFGFVTDNASSRGVRRTTRDCGDWRALLCWL